MKSTGVLVLLVTAACASDPLAEPPDREYRRDNARIEAMEKFEELKRTCARRGRAVQMHRSSSGRMSPTTDELQLAGCGPRTGTGVLL